MKNYKQANVVKIDKIQDLNDDAREALSKFRGSGNGGSVSRLLADRKSEIMETQSDTIQ